MEKKFIKFMTAVIEIGVTSALIFLLISIVVSKIIFFNADGDIIDKKPKQCAIVFGARIYPNGYPSDSLYYRTLSGINLYKDKIVSNLIFSGGKTDGIISEAEGMKELALSYKIPLENIFIDDKSYNTMENLLNSKKIAEENDCEHLIGVSHYYHLARIKMISRRNNIEIKTYPAKSPILEKEPLFFLREIGAYIYYYLFII